MYGAVNGTEGDRVPLREIRPGDYGPIVDGFVYPLLPGYTALIGANNAGKSALLQAIFRALCDDGDVGMDHIALIPPDRLNIYPTTEAGGRTLQTHNSDLAGVLRGRLNGWDYPRSDFHVGNKLPSRALRSSSRVPGFEPFCRSSPLLRRKRSGRSSSTSLSCPLSHGSKKSFAIS
jgi:hypothetical protein